jgi:hypothetical protein
MVHQSTSSAHYFWRVFASQVVKRQNLLFKELKRLFFHLWVYLANQDDWKHWKVQNQLPSCFILEKLFIRSICLLFSSKSGQRHRVLKIVKIWINNLLANFFLCLHGFNCLLLALVVDVLEKVHKTLHQSYLVVFSFCHKSISSKSVHELSRVRNYDIKNFSQI